MKQQNYNTQYKAWAAAVAATKAALIARGYTPAKAQKCALDRIKSSHPAARAAIRRNLSLNRDYIQGGAQ